MVVDEPSSDPNFPRLKCLSMVYGDIQLNAPRSMAAGRD